MRRFGRLLTYLRPYRRALTVSAGAAVVASALDGFSFTLLIPFLRLLFGEGTALAATPTAVERVQDALAGPLLDGASRGTALAVVMVLIVGALLLKNAAVYVARYLAVATQERVARDLRVALFDHLLRLGLPYFQRAKGGQLMARALSDADQTRQAVGAALIALLRNGAAVVIYIALLVALSWRLTLVTLVLAPALALCLRPVLSGVRRLVVRATEARGGMAAILHETVRGIRIVKAHGAEADERRRFREAADGQVTAVLRAQRLAVLASPLSEALGALVIGALLLVGVQAAGLGALRAEVFVTFVALSLRLLSPVKALSQFPALAAEAVAGADRIFEVLDVPPDDSDDPGARTFNGTHDEIAFRDVWVGYEPGRWAIQAVDLRVRRGEIVAIVGPSGAGKSTLVDLLARFVDPQRGAVTIDNVPLTDYSRTSLRRSLGFVSQETILFNDTVRANIAYGSDAGAGLDRVQDAARAANAHDFICALPDGYDTLVGERGTRLSGGERQRLAIARALLHDPPILILDEATSALDTASEQSVRSAIECLMRDRTVFVIAHRLSTLRHADRIVVLNEGRVVESGSHDDLLQRGGWYETSWGQDPVRRFPRQDHPAPARR